MATRPLPDPVPHPEQSPHYAWCVAHGHPGCTENNLLDATWCACGAVVRHGQHRDPITHQLCAGCTTTPDITRPHHAANPAREETEPMPTTTTFTTVLQQTADEIRALEHGRTNPDYITGWNTICQVTAVHLETTAATTPAANAPALAAAQALYGAREVAAAATSGQIPDTAEERGQRAAYLAVGDLLYAAAGHAYPEHHLTPSTYGVLGVLPATCSCGAWTLGEPDEAPVAWNAHLDATAERN